MAQNGSAVRLRSSSHDEEKGQGRAQANGHDDDSVHLRDLLPDKESFTTFRDRFMRRGKRKITTGQSLTAIARLNIFLVFIPLSWASHFVNAKHHTESWPYPLSFALCFLAIIPLERLFDYLGGQMAYYVGKDLGDFIVITLNNAVEATLAIILLTKCELRLLQATIIGVVLLHLLLIPGISFIIGGARMIQQDLHPHMVQLNHLMLAVGVLTLLIPAAFFSALDNGISSGENASAAVNDNLRGSLLKMSRGLAILLFTVYLCSRIFLHNPPGDGNALKVDASAPKEQKMQEQKLEEGDPEISQWVCIGMLVVTIALMATTAEWLVDSLEFVREEHAIQEQWFGLILLPLVSYSADGAVSVVYFIRYLLRSVLGRPEPPSALAQARPIDLSIQFLLFWAPVLVMLAWWTGRPLTLLFDTFEVALVIAACFVVNYVTADAKTNWAEGYAMVAFYVMIALCAWFYPGQPSAHTMLSCTGVQEALTSAAEHR